MDRDRALDIMKGVGILAVVLGHINAIPYMPFRHLCFSFHMPLFFLLAGYFHHVSKDPKAYIVKSAKRLLIPYIATSMIMVLFSIHVGFTQNKILEVPKQIFAVFFASGDYHTSAILPKIRPIGAIWFLAALFWCRITFNIIALKFKTHYHLVAIIIAIIATIIDIYIINLPFAILPGLSALTFYSIGNIFRNKNIHPYIKYLCVILWPISFVFCKIYMVRCYYEFYPLAILGACGGCLIVYLISKSIDNRFKLIVNIFVWLGNVSLVILCWHMIESLCKLYPLIGLPDDLIFQVPIRLLIPIFAAYLCTKFSFTKYIFQIK